MQHFGIDPVVRINFTTSSVDAHVRSQHRRDYRGDRNRPTFSKEYVYHWMPTFESKVLAQCNVTCNAVFDTYESAVNRYGYSLRSMRRVAPTPFMREFL